MQTKVNQLEKNEEVIATFADHWIVMVMPFIIYFFGWCIFAFLIYTAGLIKTFSAELGLIALLLSFLILFVIHHLLFLFLLEYQVSTLIITNKRIIENHYFPLVLDDFLFIEISQIDEIEKKKHGLFQVLFNYGDVTFSVPGKGDIHTSKYVRHPSKLINMIETLKSKKPLTSNTDLRKMGASCPKKYQFLLKQ